MNNHVLNEIGLDVLLATSLTALCVIVGLDVIDWITARKRRNKDRDVENEEGDRR
jgi:hypothetical protein